MNVKAVVWSFRHQALQFLADPQWIIPSIIAPFLFTVVALYMYGDVDGPVVLTAVLGGGVLGMWGNTLFTSGYSVSYDRYNGTMEPIMLTPTHLVDIIAGRSIWNTFIGLMTAGLVFVAAELIFQVGISVHDPLSFFLMLTLTLLSLASVGMMFAALYVLTRASFVIMTIMEFPIYVFSGALFPVSSLGPLAPVSYILAPAWGVDAMKIAGIAGYESMTSFGILFDIMMIFLLTCIYIAAGILLFRTIERNIRESGSLVRY